MAVSQEEAAKFREYLAGMSSADRATFLSSPTTNGGPTYRRMIPALDALSDDDRVKVVHACRRGRKAVAQGTSEAVALDEVAKVAPAAAVAMKGSADDRRKPYAWALEAAETYLQSDAYHAKREAKRRKVPDEQSSPAHEPPAKK